MSDSPKLVIGKPTWVEVDGQTVRVHAREFTPKKAMVTLQAHENTAEVEGVPPNPALFCCGQIKKFETRKVRVIEVL
jgi:hypothetical protein